MTQAVWALLHQEREDLKEKWADGFFTAASYDETCIRNAAATGAASVYAKLIDIDFEEVEASVYEE